MRNVIGAFAIVVLACGCSSSAESEQGAPNDDPVAGGSAGAAVSAAGGSVGLSGGSGGANPTTAGQGGVIATTGGSGGAKGMPGGSAGAASGSGGAALGTGGTASGSPDGGLSGKSIQCSSEVKPGLPMGAPALTVGTWTDIKPSGITWGENGHAIDFAVSPCNPSVLYASIGSFNSSTGPFRSVDAGATWTRIGKIEPKEASGADHLDGGAMIRLNPQDPQKVYFVEGVRGVTGFFRSSDAGDTVAIPKGFRDVGTQASLYQWDVYDIDVDPTDFKHVLLSFHGAWGWTDTKWNTNSGVLETIDGGDTWIVHEPGAGWGTGHAIHFLYDPKSGQGDRNTWLLGTQGAGMMRTTDAGKTWTKVTSANIQHGGGKVYYTQKGVLYATSGDKNIRSVDNGATWVSIGPGGGYNAITGDGMNLYTAPCFGPTSILTSSESDGLTWKDFNSQKFSQGPFEFGFDPVNRIVYASLWGAGVWALKVQ